ADEQAADLGRGGLPVHDLADHVGHLVGAEVLPVDDAGQRLADVHGRPPRVTKLRKRSLPAVVRNDSGWNWTPSTGSVRWRTAMISSSAVRAVTSRSGGTLVFSITNE